MENQEIDFIKTGKDVPIQINELLNFVYDQLNKYDQIVEATGTKPDFSPYEQSLIYTTSEGVNVQIPPEVHAQAIQNWVHVKQENQQVVKENKVEETGGSNLFMYLLVGIIILLLFYIYKTRKQ